MTTLPPSPIYSYTVTCLATAATVPHKRKTPAVPGFERSEIGAGNEARTRDLNLGKVALYQLSYSRNTPEEAAYSKR